MCDVLYGVTEAVGIVIGRVDAPLVSGTWMGSVLDSICYWVLFAVLHEELHTKGGLVCMRVYVRVCAVCVCVDERESKEKCWGWLLLMLKLK